MFQAPLCPSSGASDYTDVYTMWHVTFVIPGRGSGAWLYVMCTGWGMFLEQHPSTRTRGSINHCVSFSWISFFISSTVHGRTLIKELYLTSFVALGMPSKGNPPKNCEQTARFSFTTIPAHRSVLVKGSLTKNNVTILQHPVDFYLFPRLKSALNGRNFCDVPDIFKNATEEPKGLS
jgi:hypothetical protein